MEYIPTVGLEIHAELKTRTKMFCDSKNDPDEARPNVNVCPVCMGHPGTLPVINKEAVKQVLRVGVALGGTLADRTSFDRKNYFYPDIPKGYQISQYTFPLVSGGSLNGIAITRVHLEEDTGTLIHADTEAQMNADTIREHPRLHPRTSASLVDFNRAGVPLMELVTEPVIHSARDAADFAREFQLLLRYLGASDANMEKGEMRVEANISVARAPEIADGRGLEEPRMNADEEKSGGKLLYEELSYKVRGAVFNVRNELGSGHKESVYQNALIKEFEKNDIKYEKEEVVHVLYNKENVGVYRPDFVVDEKIILELKALPFIGKKEKEQLWHYLKGSDYRLAFIVNFGSPQLQIERLVFDSIRDNPRSHPRTSAVLGRKVEVKNLNSFRAVERAIEYEVQRQSGVLEEGGEVVQETRGWDEQKGITFSQRRKEESHDYRYFPEPDLPRISLSEISGFSASVIKESLPELPAAKRERYLKEGIRQEYADMFVADERLGNLFEETAAEIFKTYDNRTVAKTLASNYIGSDIAGLVGRCEASGLAHITAVGLAALMNKVMLNEISSRGAKDAIAEVFQRGGDLSAVSTKYLQTSSAGELEEVVRDVILKNENAVADYKNGKGAALQFLVGQGMKATKGAANPETLRELIVATLNEVDTPDE